MLVRRKSEGFNLAFLDIMSCGLGAVILIFLLVKFEQTSTNPDAENERLQQELTELIALTENVSSEADEARAEAQTLASGIAAGEQQVREMAARTERTAERTKMLQKAISNASADLNKASPQQPNDPVELKGTGQEEYLMGLKVEGKQIVLIMDTSASMIEESLDGIFQRQTSAADRRRGAKWIRTGRILRWLLARIPASSRVTVVSHRDKPSLLGGKPNIPARDGAAINAVVTDFARLDPAGGTNLTATLDFAKAMAPDASAIYMVTDGLPTITSEGQVSRLLRGCSGSSGISNDCREKIFNAALRESDVARSTTVNVVLLPLEGELTAPAKYWEWTRKHRGITIVPAQSWP